MDRIYSPPQLAAKLVEHVQLKRPVRIADFSAGDGELLKAARKKWPKSRFIATDINPASVFLLRRTETSWDVGQCDFLNQVSRTRCKAIAQALGKISLALLNPPFSCRGGTLWSAEVNGTTVRCGLAMAFVLTSIPYLVAHHAGCDG